MRYTKEALNDGRFGVTFVTLLSVAVLVVVLAGCDLFGPEETADPGAGRLGSVAQVTSVSGRVPGRTDGSVEYFGYDESFSPVTVATADIELDGTFLLDLVGVVPAAAALLPMTIWSGFDLTALAFLQISNEDALITYHRGFMVYTGEDMDGSVMLFDGPDIVSPGPGIQVNWMYADRDVEIVGSGTVESMELTFDLILKQGWNQYIGIIEDGGNVVKFYTGPVPSGVDWYFKAAPPID